MPIEVNHIGTNPSQQAQLFVLLSEFGLVVNCEEVAEPHPKYAAGARTSIHIATMDEHPEGLVQFFSLAFPAEECTNSNIEFFFDENGKFLSLEFAH